MTKPRYTLYMDEFTKYFTTWPQRNKETKSFRIATVSSLFVFLFAWIYVLLCFSEGIFNLAVGTSRNDARLTGWFNIIPSSDFVLAIAIGCRLWFIRPGSIDRNKCNQRPLMHSLVLFMAISGYVLFMTAEYFHMSLTGCFWDSRCNITQPFLIGGYNKIPTKA